MKVWVERRAEIQPTNSLDRLSCSSNGEKGRIHVSEQTANLLIEAGKAHWVTPRDEKIEAKGKGSLQTYWVSVVSSAGDRTSAMTSAQSSCSDDIRDALERRWNPGRRDSAGSQAA